VCRSSTSAPPRAAGAFGPFRRPSRRRPVKAESRWGNSP
jgi:hypothetical protein